MSQSRLSGTQDYVGEDAAALRKAWGSIALTFARYGYAAIDPPILEPASAFLERSGEDIRRHMYIFSDPGGREICLRPELTIPACRAYLRNFQSAERETRLSYVGPAFRYDSPGPARFREFYQAGVEFIGAAHRYAADAEIMAIALDTLSDAGLKDATIVMGDLGILDAFIDGLPIGDTAKSRLRRVALRKEPLRHVQPRSAAEGGLPPDLNEIATLLSSIGSEKAERLLGEIFTLADVRHVGGRTPEEIITRLIGRSSQAASEEISPEILDGVSALVAIRAEPQSAFAALRALFGSFGIGDADRILEPATRRIALLGAHDVSPTAHIFDAGLRRGLDYYTGFVFEIYATLMPEIEHICGGGRYDTLLSALGASSPTPAVGFGVGIERILLATREAGAAARTPLGAPDALVVAAGAVREEDCIRVSAALRKAGWSVETESSGRRPKNVIPGADERGIAYVVFVGEDELRSGNVSIRHLKDHREKTVPLAALADFVKAAGTGTPR